jgi:3-oxoacyl-(acyl-carrier-protein) synthase
MPVYIRSAASISPQDTFAKNGFLDSAVVHTGNVLKAIEPDYKDIIDAKLIRRMSRILRIGVATAMGCLDEAGIKNPDAIITGTAYGCLADTEMFLSRIIEQGEEMLSPTAFIQSTHNTAGAQTALMLQCNNYNNTFVHGGFSFESALLDAIMLLGENEVSNALVGNIDELTEISHSILNRFGFYKRVPVSNMELYASRSKGTIAGEGSAFFVLTSEAAPGDYTQIDGVATLYKPKDTLEIAGYIDAFLKDHFIAAEEVDLIIMGRNGDYKNDATYDELQRLLFSKNDVINYKHLCGEYPTAVSFALWMAANIIKTQQVPAVTGYNRIKEKKLNKVLICNNYQDHHSVILLSAC